MKKIVDNVAEDVQHIRKINHAPKYRVLQDKWTKVYPPGVPSGSKQKLQELQFVSCVSFYVSFRVADFIRTSSVKSRFNFLKK